MQSKLPQLICPKCKNKYPAASDMKYCICGGELKKDLDFRDFKQSMEEIFGKDFSSIFSG